MSAVIRSSIDTVASGFVFTEDPRWRNGRLYFSDTVAGEVRAVDELGQCEKVTALGDHCSGLGFMPNGDLLIVAARQRKLMRLTPTGLIEHADLSALAVALNDMAVDRHGRAYPTELKARDASYAEFLPSALFIVQPDGTADVAADDLLFANGTVISDDGKTMITAETMRHRLTMFDIEADGRLSNRQIFAELPAACMPDGISLDTEGGIWASCPGADSKVIRVERGGRITHELPMAKGRMVYACMLGGHDRRTLFLCTGETHLPDAGREKRAGAIDAVRVGFQGAGLP